MFTSIRVTSLLFVLVLSSHLPAEDWPRWRGPNDSGSAEGGSYPTEWNVASALWRAALPGKGCSTPIVVRGKIILTAPAEGNDSVLAFDAAGVSLWQTTFGKEAAGKHRNGSGSNASPVTDGDGVFVYFKSGTLAAVELDGTRRWDTNLVQRFGPDTLFWDHGTSPVLTERHVVMARMHQGESWLAAFDKDSGEMAWKVPRNYTTPIECDHGYTTPLVIEYAGKESLLVWGAEHLTIHDASSGAVVWSCGGFNSDSNKLWPAIATPVVVGDIAVIAYGRNDRGMPRLHGVQLIGSGNATEENRVWDRADVGTFVPTPVAYQGKVYLVGDKGRVECISAETGKSIWSDRLPRGRAAYYASPLIAGDILYAPREDGVVMVASIANDKFELLAQNDMGEPVIASPVPMETRILIRGNENLFCLGNP